MSHFAHAIAVIFVLCAALHASPVVRGLVTDSTTQDALLGANVMLNGTLLGTATNDEGRFHLHVPDTGGWTLRVSSMGYKGAQREFHIGANDTLDVSFALIPDLLQADEVVITAEARESTARLSTTKVEVVNAAEIARRAPGSLDKVLDHVPGLEVHRTGGPVVSNVSIRGSSDMLGGGVGNRTLLLVDGKPAIISDTDGASWWLYPDDVIERVEVVKGAYSALYGSNAMGGVVNLITKSPSFREYTRIHAATGFYQRPPEWMKYSEQLKNLGLLSFSHSNTVGKLGYFANITRRTSDGFRQSSAYENTVFYTKLKHSYTPARATTFSLLYLTGDNEYPHPWVNGLEPLKVRDIYANDVQQKRSLSADLVYRRVQNEKTNYVFRTFYNRDLTRSLLNPASDSLAGDLPVGFQTQSTSQKFGLLEQSTLLLPAQNTFIYGFETIWDHVDGRPEDYLYGQQAAFNAAGFVQNEYAPAERWKFTVGARYDWRRLREHKSSQQLSPKAGVSYQPIRNLAWRASVGHAFRNPSIAEMFLKRVGNQDYEFIPNPTLTPENVNFGETGLNWAWDDLIIVDGALFAYKYTDIIRWVGAGTYRTENLSEATIQGGELAVRTAWPAAFLQSAALTYLDTDIDHHGPLTYISKWRFLYSLSYEFRKATANLTARYVSPTDSVIFYQNDAPDAYFLLDARVTFRFRQSTRLSLICENLTDEFYQEMERYAMPPRTYRAELVYEFDVGRE
jgi:iron complex outermembrane receptor protein